MARAGEGRELRARLKGLGLSDAAVRAAWPRWWAADAEGSVSARAELRFGVARRLGIDPRSLFDDADAPRFVWRDEARFKHLSGESETELAGITSFGHAVAGAIEAAMPDRTVVALPRDANELRTAILGSGQSFVGLVDLLSVCWAASVPVVHLRVFPWQRKRMAAMTVALERWTVLLGKDSAFPAVIAFYLAHELGHIVLGHIPQGTQLVDLGDDDGPTAAPPDDEEGAADAFALRLLTGDERLQVLPEDPTRVSAGELARTALGSADALQIEPGTLALAFGYTTKNWAVANAALRRIYPDATGVWRQINATAEQQLTIDELPVDTADFVRAVLGDRG